MSRGVEILTRERLIADQSARELASLLTPGQRALVSLLATAELYGLSAKALVEGYARETGLAAAARFAQRLPGESSASVHPLDVARGMDDLMPQTCLVALNSSRASGSLEAFYRSWLSQSVDDRIHFVRHEHTHAAKLGRLAFRSLICVWFLSIILLYVVPEHLKIYEEFGMELSGIATAFLRLSTLVATAFPFFLLLMFCLCLYVVCFKRNIFANYFRRWLPGRWRQVVFPQPVLRRKLLAWDLLALRSAAGSADASAQGDTRRAVPSVADWDSLLAKRELTSREAGVLQNTSRPETQAWLLRNMADNKFESRKNRLAFAIGTLSYLVQALLAVMIVMATFTIFSMLVELMRGLS